MELDLISKYLFLSYFVMIFFKKLTNINGFSEKLASLNFTDTYRISIFVMIYLGASLSLVLFSDARNRYPKYMKVKNKMGRLGIALLIGYLVVSIYNFHNIFADMGNLDMFFLNASLIGGLLILYQYYTIYINVDNYKKKKNII